MSGFSTEWLALREPFDHAARAGAIPPDFLAALMRRVAPGAALSVVDLGCGTGANLREIAPRLGGRQRWRMVDHDAQLLAAIPEALAPWAAAQGLQVESQPQDAVLVLQRGGGLHIEVERCQADLVGGLDVLPLAGAQLVTASALLDLVSAPWLDALMQRCQDAGAAVWWALNVDDRLVWTPGDADDALVHGQFLAHQQRDKGFGPALGGSAAALAARHLARAGWRVAQARSDWRIDGRQGDAGLRMLRAMVEGIGSAAAEQAPALAGRVVEWQARRLAQRDGLRLEVGHTDVLAWPA
ncbi:MAG: SAM-dependent methyltransferase [Variovorax sp.]|nr:MAG: SAM-dependent methyltransferase [Variovorax sp.]